MGNTSNWPGISTHEKHRILKKVKRLPTNLDRDPMYYGAVDVQVLDQAFDDYAKHNPNFMHGEAYEVPSDNNEQAGAETAASEDVNSDGQGPRDSGGEGSETSGDGATQA